MRAMVQTGFGGPEVVRLRHVPDPAPGPAELVVEVGACALNRLDVLQRRGPAVLPGFRLPHIAGTDVAGTVVATGPRVSGYAVGDRVVLDPTIGCGTCARCQAGDAGFCPALRVVGGNIPGGFAEYVAAPARLAYRLPAHVSLDEAAALPTAWSTAYRATHGVGQVRSGETVVVQAAASAVSIAAIQLAKRAGAAVVAVASTGAKLAVAADLGADLLLRNDDDVPAAVRDHTGGRGADLVLDHVGAATWSNSVASLAIGGRLVVFGNTSGDQVEFSLADVYHRGLRLLGAGAYGAEDFTAVLDAYCAGGLRALRAGAYGLAELPAAFAHQESRDTIGKVLVLP
ncbi:alcohol dehydrogenase [Phytohabitans rumicis]|uniref:Alcohol dehydrogenase n=2 Tax=Phytohabitans rumicis TaxID=1076125 RepID=A0A6V8LB50_9ACTN|nr:alcohol dehydrogenase [Phytohabitans rumicis]